jgi:hypothetical protein
MIAVVLASGVVGSVVVDAAGPAPASAAVYYGVSMETQCSRQYGWNAHAAWINGANPYSWFCFRWGGGSMTVGFPSGISATVEITPIGGIDVGSYCRWKYGTIFRPLIINYNVWAWRCTA